MARALTISALAALSFATVSAASAAPPPPAAPSRLETPSDRPGAYSDNARSLARVLGAAHYVRVLCNGKRDQKWREFMRGLLDREPRDRRSLIDAFNEGYRDHEFRFPPPCDAAAVREEEALKAQGQRLAGALAARNSG